MFNGAPINLRTDRWYMKFIHTSDIHLDSRIDGLPTEKSRIRREEVLSTFERIAEFASQNGVRAIIIAGDAFDTSRITVKTKDRLIKTIEKYPEVDFLFLTGNHDERTIVFGEENAPNNLKTFGENWTKYRYGNVCISGAVLSHLNSKSIYDGLRLEKEEVNLVVLHGQVVGYKSNSDAEIISIPALKDKNIDYLALGHIHSYSKGKIDDRGEYAYSGCPEGRGFDELGQKGFVLLDCGDKKVSSQFVPFSKRQLFEVEYSLESFDNFYKFSDFIIKDLTSKIPYENLVKVIIKGGHKTDFYVDKYSLDIMLNQKYFFAKVYDKSQLLVSSEDYAVDKSVKGEFVREVLESNLSDEQKNKIIMTGLYALKGEEFL